MLIDIVNGSSRVVYTTLREIKSRLKVSDPLDVKDGLSNAIYSNSIIGEGSRIGEDCLLIACIIKDGVEIGRRSYMIGCEVGNEVYVGEGAFIQNYTLFGNRVRIDSFARIGSDCRFGDGTEIRSSSRMGEHGVFGDDTRIGHWNVLDSVEFGARTRIGVGNTFYSHPKFTEMPILEESENESQTWSVHIFQSTELDRTGNKGRSCIRLKEYLEKRPDIWKIKT